MRRWTRRRRVPYWQTQRWRDRNARFKQLPRAQRCAACATTRRLVTHHLTYARRWWEWNIDLVRLCWRCHSRVHRLAWWLTLGRSRTRHLYLATGLVVACTRLFGRRAPHAVPGRRAA